MEIDLTQSLGPGDCIVCGTPRDNHDDTKCEDVVKNWKPTGIFGLLQTDNNEVTEQ